MIKPAITYLNEKLKGLGYFIVNEGLADRIERDGKVYPGIYKGNGEYKKIEIDNFGSFSYWRKNGDVTMTSQDNKSGVGVQCQTDISLKLVCFTKKEITSDQYFSDSLCASIISELTVNNSGLKKEFKAKRATVSARKYVTDSRIVERDEYDVDGNSKIDTMRYSHAYFSIDFTLSIVTDSQCSLNICVDC